MELDESSSKQLPVCHVYYPDTFCKVLGSYFSSAKKESNSSDDEIKCYLLGLWELRDGKPGRGKGKVNKIKKEHSLRRRRNKKGIMTFPPTTSGSTNEAENAPANDNIRRVLAVNIIGICSEEGRRSHEELSSNFCNVKLEVVGEVRFSCTGNEVQNESRLQFPGIRLHFEFDSIMTSPNQLSINAVTWNGQLHRLHCSSRLVLFQYEPSEFQQWKLPTDYPIGVPPVFVNGLSFIQQELQMKNQLSFTPAFPPVLQNHQNLNACSEEITASSSVYYNQILNFISRKSSGLQQISHKVSLLTGTAIGSYQVLPALNFLVLIALDSLMGYLITTYLMQIPNLLGLLHTTVDDMLDSLNHLLRWLRGAPAGLKLNANLNSLYWRFFSYHIHLWANYIGLLEPIFTIILHTIQYYGLLGCTIQVSLLKDLLSLATFHVYCLYIYASRLYSLQTSAIKSLFRIFFGRKYNPLRERIDNVQLATPELFLSSFCFVILIFLLPTTMVYYAGFVCLRVPVFLMEKTLKYFVERFNKLPVISWILVYINSPRVADEIYLSSEEVPSTKMILDSNKNYFITFRLCLRSTRTLFSPPDFGGGIKNIVGCVMHGNVLK